MPIVSSSISRSRVASGRARPSVLGMGDNARTSNNAKTSVSDDATTNDYLFGHAGDDYRAP